ncbi:MAG: hypothetical protein KGH58_04635, partial [Candidatus Micrarchaeota archaeon]|nr:hypothetical protein [Candidatus Micrarchaeota archaeon]
AKDCSTLEKIEGFKKYLREEARAGLSMSTGGLDIVIGALFSGNEKLLGKVAADIGTDRLYRRAHGQLGAMHDTMSEISERLAEEGNASVLRARLPDVTTLHLDKMILCSAMLRSGSLREATKKISRDGSATEEQRARISAMLADPNHSRILVGGAMMFFTEALADQISTLAARYPIIAGWSGTMELATRLSAVDVAINLRLVSGPETRERFRAEATMLAEQLRLNGELMDALRRLKAESERSPADGARVMGMYPNLDSLMELGLDSETVFHGLTMGIAETLRRAGASMKAFVGNVNGLRRKPIMQTVPFPEGELIGSVTGLPIPIVAASLDPKGVSSRTVRVLRDYAKGLERLEPMVVAHLEQEDTRR